jgi:hypothetical protein
VQAINRRHPTAARSTYSAGRTLRTTSCCMGSTLKVEFGFIAFG